MHRFQQTQRNLPKPLPLFALSTISHSLRLLKPTHYRQIYIKRPCLSSAAQRKRRLSVCFDAPRRSGLVINSRNHLHFPALARGARCAQWPSRAPGAQVCNLIEGGVQTDRSSLYRWANIETNSSAGSIAFPVREYVLSQGG